MVYAILLLYIILLLFPLTTLNRLGICLLTLIFFEAFIYTRKNRSYILQYFDSRISSSTIRVLIGVAIAIVIWFVIGVVIIFFLEIPTGSEDMSSGGFTYMLITDPGTILDSFKENHTPWYLMPFLCIISIIGFILVCGIMISVFSNFFQRRVDDYKNGVIRYQHLKNHIVIIGFDEIVPSLVKQKCKECEDDGSNSSILILSKKNSKEVREHVNSTLTKEEEKRLIVYCGRRDSKDELETLNLKEAKEIFILGNRENDGHDTLNIDCLVKMNTIIGEWKDGKEKIPVSVMFDNYATFSAFQSDLSKEWRKSFKFKPFNFYDYWAQKVIIDHGYDGTNDVKYIEYPRIEGNEPLRDGDDVVNVIIFGITSMGVAIATQAAHYLHFSKKKDNSIRKSRITFICANAREEMDMFRSYYSSFFEIQSSIFRDFIDGNGEEEEIPPTVFKGDNGNFLDIEFEFINGESYHPGVRDFLRDLAKDENQRISIFITTGNDRRDMNIGMSLPEELYHMEGQKTTPIFVHQKKSGELLRLLEDISNEKYKEIYPFGMIDTTLNLNFKNLYKAQILNLIYSKGLYDINVKNEAIKEWDKLPSAHQWSSLYCANSFELKQKEFKLIENKKIKDIKELETCFKKNKEELCEIEQNRWNVEKLLMGFRKPHEDEQQKIDEDRKTNSNNYLCNKYKKEYIHDLIRPFDEIKQLTWKDTNGSEVKDSIINEKLIDSIYTIEEILLGNNKNKDSKPICKNKYAPAPVDTSDIRLPEELSPLLEAMAKNVHEIWAQERMNQKWSYGEKRDDAQKHHPCLIAYEDLPEEEKMYDRNTSVETLKLIIKLGFKIEKRK